MMSALELQLDRARILDALHKAQGVIDRKSTVNILSHLLIEPAEGGIRVTGTDYDVVLQADVTAEVISEGSACVNGKSLFDVIRAMADPSVHLKVLDNHWVEVTAGRSRFKLAGMPADDFPEIQVPDDVTWIAIDRGTLKDMVEKTAFSVSNDETRMNLNGVFLRIESGEDNLARITMVSTDGHRLSRVQVDIEAAGFDGTVVEAIVHKKGVTEVKRLLDGDATTIEVGFTKGRVLFRAEGTVYTVRQIEDSYPDYQRVIPPSSPVRLEVDRNQAIAALKRIAILTSNKTYIIKMELTEGKITFASSNPDYGEGQDELDVVYSGDGMVVGFNYLYLLDVLNVIRGDKAVIELADEYSPAVLTSPAEPGALFVIMPMRI